MSHITPGMRWPPPDDAARLARYADGRDLYTGAHYQVYQASEAFIRMSSANAAFAERFATIVYEVINALRLITDDYVDLMASRPPEVIASSDDAQRAIDKIVARSQLWRRLLQAEITASTQGDYWLRSRLTEHGAVIETVEPSHVFMTPNPLDVESPTSPIVAITIQAGSGATARQYLLVEHHDPGVITYELWELARGRIVRQVDLGVLWDEGDPSRPPENVVTIPGEITLIHVPNLRLAGEMWGRSDYTADLQTANFRINDILSQMHHHIERNLSGGMRVLPGAWRHRISQIAGSPPASSRGAPAAQPSGSDYGRRAASSIAAGIDPGEMEIVTESADEAGTTRFVPVAAGWEGAFAEIETALARMFLIAGLPIPESVKGGSAPESGKALFLKLTRAIRRVRRKQLFRTPALQRAISLALQLEGRPPETPQVRWQLGIEVPFAERLDDAIRLMETGLLSPRSALHRMFPEMTPEAIDAELADAEDARARRVAVMLGESSR